MQPGWQLLLSRGLKPKEIFVAAHLLGGPILGLEVSLHLELVSFSCHGSGLRFGRKGLMFLMHLISGQEI